MKFDPLPPDWPWKNCLIGMAGPFKKVTMTIEEALEFIKASIEYYHPGEFSIESNKLFWDYSMNWPDEDPGDHLWSK